MVYTGGCDSKELNIISDNGSKKGGVNAACIKTKSTPVVMGCYWICGIVLFGERGNLYPDEYSFSPAVRPASVPGG
jgi:hypothetical protein